MVRSKGLVVVAFAGLLVLVLTVLAPGCSADPPPPRWEKVTSGSFNGAKTEHLDLGTQYLTGQVRLAWDLSGPSDARAEFTLEALRQIDAATSTGGGQAVRSWTEQFALQSDRALSMSLEPDYYRVTLSQALRPRDGVGYSGTFTLYTQDVD
jgi:hypothetical protein